MNYVRIAVLVAALFGVTGGRADAQLTNGGFETGTFAGWLTSGDTAVIGTLGPPGTPVPPDSGSFQAYLKTIPAAVPAAALEAFLGLAPGAISALDPASGAATQGSAIKQTITVVAGSTLTFRYNFMTTETPIPNTLKNDLCFFSVVGPGGTLVRMANTTGPFGPGPMPYHPSTNPGDGMTGYKTFSYTFPASGVVTVGFGVVDMGDTLRVSGLLLDGNTIGGGSGVTVNESGGSTDVTEGGITDAYTVVLNSAPTANVTINIATDGQTTIAPATMTFTPANWNVPQTVTVTAVDNAIVDGLHKGVITHAAVSADPLYNGVVINNVVANITDNDTPQPGGTWSGNGEGTYQGSSGVPSSGGEGSFGFGASGMRAAPGLRAANAIIRRPILYGPVLARSGTVQVFNVSHRKAPTQESSADTDMGLLGWTLLSAFALGLTAFLVGKYRPT